ncbi:hematopoietic progenitor cell antigen CD34 [Tyto alba]|uniref:hematopoietic progenitor cell antigen CD34 n=1 Tax=Tyto alba TaxID=56313 RepID=UPI001C6846A1|nr:hematopoietic progenitor cell antigen CD34 [Tyto alba]
MLFLGSFKIMKWRQLFWIAFCVVELCGNTSGSPTDTPTPTATAVATKGTSSSAATGAPGTPSSAEPTPETSAATGSLAASPTSPGLSSEQPSPQPSQTPTQALGTPSDPHPTSRGVPTTESPATRPSTVAETPGPTAADTSSPATSEHPPISAATTPQHAVGDSPKPITCHNVKEVSDTRAICLQLNESVTCKHFLEMKGSDLWSVICEESDYNIPPPCRIKLAKSEVDHDCLLLILVGETDPATDMLQESHWEKFGIKSLKRASVRNHQDFSQKTLIALVTSGLMLAFLGLAGYFLMKRRSWSPAGERLAEDPYYTENGSQGNTMLMMPPQEHPELQEKPNLNGGTQENGTGQASSKNGHSARQHSPADTEM